MKKTLCRHRDPHMFEVLGYGTIEQDFGYKCVVNWLIKKHTTVMHKKFLILLDESEKDGFREF